MNDKTTRLLEFQTLRARVAGRCLSEESSERLEAEEILTDPQAVRELKASTAEFVNLLQSGISAPSLILPRIGQFLPRLGKEGTSLELEEAYALGLFVRSSSDLKRWLSGEGAGERLRAEAAELPDCSAVEREVFRILDKDGTLRDLPEFREIKRRIQGLRRDLETLTNRYLTDEETRKMLQSDIATQRDGRIVIAVKANYRSRIRGIVHEVSATGQTIFVEPEDVVDKNNDILLEERRLSAEVARVLREMTSRIGERRDDLVLLREKVLHLDCLRARARYSIDSSGTFALDPSPRLSLRGARHPLLGPSAVPIDLSMDEATRVVIVTGPNTGGKTVALKTVGLFALMNQFGLAVPALEGTTIPIFDGVYADIGDEQSISQSLSTFSAHMKNMASIVAAATPQSLVLLDELGSGTDPEEGSAIAMSILDHFIELQATVLTTSHHGILKNYGYTKPGVVNASVDFDAATLSPTYRIILGIPGESRAIDIASRNGLQSDIVSRARSYLAEERADVSALIRGLKEKRRELDVADEARRKETRSLQDDRRKVDLRALRLRQREAELREQGLGSLNRLLSESRKTLENLVRELREGELTREKTLKVKEFLSDLERTTQEQRDLSDDEETTLRDEERAYRAEADREDREASEVGGGKRRGEGRTAPSPMEPPALAPGIEVLVGPSRRRGVIVRPAKKAHWVVEVGAVKMTFPERDLTAVAGERVAAKPEIAVADLAGSTTAALELNLRGMRLEEALEALRRQLDAATLGGLYEFSIIHGKGDGILQRGVHEYLKNQRVVADYYFARPEEGGFGKTVVSLVR